MIQEDKQLLLKDLCARLPYGVHLFTNSKHHIRLLTISNDIDYDEQYWINGLYDIDEVKPYLRPMSSMTDEERTELSCLSNDKFKFYLYTGDNIIVCDGNHNHLLDSIHIIDWLNAHHFDYRGLIPLSLAIEVTEENNPYEEH